MLGVRRAGEPALRDAANNVPERRRTAAKILEDVLAYRCLAAVDKKKKTHNATRGFSDRGFYHGAGEPASLTEPPDNEESRAEVVGVPARTPSRKKGARYGCSRVRHPRDKGRRAGCLQTNDRKRPRQRQRPARRTEEEEWEFSARLLPRHRNGRLFLHRSRPRSVIEKPVVLDRHAVGRIQVFKPTT